MQINVLVVPDCPNQSDALTRVHAALAESGVDDAVVHTFTVADLKHAEALRMHGSPTIIINGRDPFAADDSVPSISCRLYRSPAGIQGCPTVEQLVEAIIANVS